MATDMTIAFKGREYSVTQGFTPEEFVESLASQYPEAATAMLIEDEPGKKWTLKEKFADKG